MNDNMVNAFLAIYESGSIGEASKNLNQSKTNVRYNLISLEENLGVNLFFRSKLGMTPTAEAKKLYDIMKYLKYNINELERFYNKNNEKSGLRIATNYIEYVAYSFTQTVETLGNDSSTYTYTNASSDAVLDMILNDKCDIGIFCFDDEMKHLIDNICAINDLRYKILAKVSPAIYVRKNHPLTAKKSLVATDLKLYGRIALNFRENILINYSPKLERSSLSLKPEIGVDSVGNVISFLQASDFYYIALYNIENKRFIKSLEIVPIKFPVANMNIVWCCKKGYSLNKEALNFSRLIKDFFDGGV